MTSTSVHRRRALAARLLPFLVVFGSIPLMAPSCGSSGEGPRVFSRRSLIIPMDVCYQYMDDASQTLYGDPPYAPAGGTTACPAVDPGDVMKAYGLVYQLIRNGIAVYWVIEDTKQSVDAVDLTVQYPGGFPVFLFDWGTGLEGTAPSASLPGDKHTINYRGGPFVVDGADFDRASRVLQNLRATFGTVNVHVSNVAFRGYSKRTMAGGWNAGGAIEPKLALLDIGSSGSGSKNSEVVIRGYLTAAGLDTPGAMGYADEKYGPHGEIFDRLFLPDFLGTPAGQPWTESNLAKNKYQILWVPHWLAPGSCRDCPPSTSCTCRDKYPESEIAETLRNIGSFVNSVNPSTNTRGDLFAECAGLGSFEGVFRYAEPSTSPYSSNYVLPSELASGGEPSTHFQTQGTTGFWINRSVNGPAYHGNFNSPLMQIGDYPFVPFTGAIQNFKPTAYKGAEVVRLISDSTNSTYDVFTMVPASTSHGTIVYLGGHSYTDSDGDFQVAGSRLVLNTLFNLGASCTADGVPCQTGLPGVCGTGKYVCGTGPDPVCVPNVQVGQLPEICNGLDDNCNGQVDEGLQTECYDPPPGYVDPDGRSTTDFFASRRLGLCTPGMKVCQPNGDGTYGMSACTGQRLPEAESCDGYDNDCDGVVDDGIAPRSCYDGPQTTLNVGECRAGLQVCNLGQWGAFDPVAAPSVFLAGQCGGEVLPRGEVCSDSGAPGGAKDDDCDGIVNNGCTCSAGPPAQTQQCFTGPGTAGVGTCRAGSQTCQVGGFWSACTGQVVATTTEACVPADVYLSADCANYPATTTCRTYDTNCDNRVEKCRDCARGDVQAPCPIEALPVLSGGATWGTGQCARGSRACTAEGTWGACTGYVLPSADADGPIEYCDGLDNDCDGAIDENAICPVNQTCIRGVCVQQYCGTERAPPEGYACSPGIDPSGLHTVISSGCGDRPAPGCGIGQVCTYGNCIDPCPASGTQVDPDTLRSVSLVCGKGTVCGGGACIGGSCYETGCPDVAGHKELCRAGTCQPDPCDGKLCPSGAFCRQGDCVQACTFVTCYTGEKCGQEGFCEPDPCAGKLCGAGQQCIAGACIADPCLGKGCAGGQVCVADGTTPLCVDDPCAGVVCPSGECAGGQCFRSGNPTGAGTAGRTETTSSSKGCGCGSGTGVALPGLLALFLVPLARRRRPAPGGRGALLLVLLSIALVGSACKEKKTQSQFDPTSCTATCPGLERCIDLATDPDHCGACGHACGSGYQCVDSVCGPASLIAPYLRSVTPASAPKDALVTVTLAGDRFREKATVRIGVGTTVSRTVTCEAVPGECQFIGAGTLSLKLDLTGATPGTPIVLRVVNPDSVISNTRTFGVTIPTPTVVGVAPDTVQSGVPTTVVVSGTGFTAGSRCHLGTIPGVGDLALVTRVTGAGVELGCDVPASVPNGSFTLTVESEPDGSGVTHVSNGVALTLSPSDPVVYTVDPPSATTLAGFLISGTRFDVRTAKVLFQPPAGNVLAPAYVTTIDSGAILVHGLPVGAGTPYANGLYTVAVRNELPGGAFRISNGVSFSVGSQAAPTLTSFTPSTVFQGNPAQQLRFQGTNITGSPRIEVQLPGSSTYTAVLPTTLDCSAGPCLITATRSFVGAPEGSWNARVRFGSLPTDATSAPWPLRVLSNQAILRDYVASPGLPQGGTVGEVKTRLAFTVGNIRGPDFTQVRVILVDPTGVNTVATLYPNVDPTETTTTLEMLPVPPATSVLSLAGRDVGTYTFRVLNPNATASNALPFTVNAGRPTLSSPVCVAGTSCTRFARQGDLPVTIRLTGTNFAKLDANGNGSVVMAAADLSPAVMAGWPSPDPCDVVTTAGTRFQQVPGTVTVVSPTQIDVQVDTRSAFVDPTYGTTYYLGVWNPGGVSGLQKSSCGVDPRTLPWFRLCATDACAR